MLLVNCIRTSKKKFRIYSERADERAHEIELNTERIPYMVHFRVNSDPNYSVSSLSNDSSFLFPENAIFDPIMTPINHIDLNCVFLSSFEQKRSIFIAKL